MQPITTSSGKCAPTPTLIKAINKPKMTIIDDHKILLVILFGINANITMLMVVKTVIECPDGRLLNPTSFSPIITKVSLSSAAAGLGTEKKAFSNLENIAATIVADNNDSQTLGA